MQIIGTKVLNQITQKTTRWVNRGIGK